MLRHPVVAGMFYEDSARELLRQVKALWPQPKPKPQEALGAVIPHAGYVYSGKTAARVYAVLPAADVYFLLGPNHTGRGSALALSAATVWKTPLGDVDVDQELSERLIGFYAEVRRDEAAHSHEHSLEVQLPFIQIYSHQAVIVPLVLCTQQQEKLQALGRALAQTIRASGKKCLVIASSDMNHFESLSRTEELDRLALEKISALDPAGLLHTVRQNHISMCGAGPVAAMLYAALELGARRAKVLEYTTSAAVSQDTQKVVGYAGVIVQ
ncbi:AmmeMemoRadiSam system protein B [candidate division FCPU426 bacterium]|nr:AmmeMemoRadiSam system protein B [candidate division FCPU426 bacterium]